MVKYLDESISFYQTMGFTIENRSANHYAQPKVCGIVTRFHTTSEGDGIDKAGNKLLFRLTYFI